MSFFSRLHAHCGAGFLSSYDSGDSRKESCGDNPPSFAFAHTLRQFERDRPFLVSHLKLTLVLAIEERAVVGTAALHIQRVDAAATEIALDAVEFEVEQVAVEGRPALFRYDRRLLVISIPLAVNECTITISYRTVPRRGLYFLAPDSNFPHRPRQVWTQCQEEDARYWFPAVDKPHVKMKTELTVLVPHGWFALSNGELVLKETPSDQGSRWKYRWRMERPHPSYLVTLVAGEYAELKESDAILPMSYFVPLGKEEDGWRTFKNTYRMLQLFEKLTGVKYPWAQYAQIVVADFLFGGMENTSATTLYEHVLVDDRAALDISSDSLIAHELAHQWFGNYVTCRDWPEGWLNEGFATYMEHVWRAADQGKDEYDYGLKIDLDAYLEEAASRYRRPLVCQEYDSPLDLFDRHLYEKGGLVLHLLCNYLGPVQFWKGIHLYLTKHAYDLVETRDLMRDLEEVSGRSLAFFFDQWVYRAGHPQLHLELQWNNGFLTLNVCQKQLSPSSSPSSFPPSSSLPHALPFRFPLICEIGFVAKDTSRKKIEVTQAMEQFVLPCPERPSFVVVDPDMDIIAEVELRIPSDMLCNQLQHAPSARGRWIAATALGTWEDRMVLATLADCLAREEEFWGVRVECANALAKFRTLNSFAILHQAVKTGHPKVRRGIVAALGQFRTEQAYQAILPYALQDTSYLVEAAALQSLGKTRQRGAFEHLVQALARPSWGDVISVGAIQGLAALRDPQAIQPLLERVQGSYSSKIKNAAMAALAALTVEQHVREVIEEQLENRCPSVRGGAAHALKGMGERKAMAALSDRLEREPDARAKRSMREALRALGQEQQGAVQQLQEQVEKLEMEHAAMKSRLIQLEARFAEAGSSPAVLKVGQHVSGEDR
ncbi:M1 family aminopeptidase [Pajaroellobacter abortibovis]|uniref:Aminopeptidase N n=1 Tax=Pajaroellobacter abortibovis TaxID=1882918 RepID=A0A1L6MYL2_9BACT|nr:M1 family aminopeptidase [Pajaroellobacter abortibovis]APS00602.1 hypothetical protein BCY86_07900 [Pajaroellobacter abortibovis]